MKIIVNDYEPAITYFDDRPIRIPVGHLEAPLLFNNSVELTYHEMVGGHSIDNGLPTISEIHAYVAKLQSDDQALANDWVSLLPGLV